MTTDPQAIRFFGKAITRDPMSQNEQAHPLFARVYVLAPSLSSRDFILPNALGMPLGGPYFLVFRSGASGTLRIVDNDLTQLVASVAQDQVLEFLLVDNSTSAGTWLILSNTSGNRVAARSQLPTLAMFFGGHADGLEALEYSPVTTVWTDRANAPNAHQNGQGFVLGSLAYVVGDLADGANDEYDPNSWTNRTATPETNWSAVGFTLDSKGYIVGGLVGAALQDNNEEYVSDAWTSRLALPVNRAHSSIATAGGKAFLVGGSSTTSFSATIRNNYEYTPPSGTEAWVERYPLPYPARSQGEGAELLGKAYFFGGSATVAVGINVNVDILDPTRHTWSKGTDFPGSPRYSHAVCEVEGRAVLAAGRDGTEDVDRFDDSFEYTPEMDVWVAKSDLPAVTADWDNQGLGVTA